MFRPFIYKKKCRGYILSCSCRCQDRYLFLQTLIILANKPVSVTRVTLTMTLKRPWP